MNAKPPVLFIDIDDVLCLARPYGLYEVGLTERPADLWERLLHPPAVEVLQLVVRKHRPCAVITSSWSRFLSRAQFEEMFRETGLCGLELHAYWRTRHVGMSREQAISAWLRCHGLGRGYAILDDTGSGIGLAESSHALEDRVVMCEIGVGLNATHLTQLDRALGRNCRATTKQG